MLSKVLAASALVAGAAIASHDEVTTFDFEDVERGVVVTTEYQSLGLVVSAVNGSGSGFQPGLVLDVDQFHDLDVYPFGNSPNQALLYGVVGDTLRLDFVLPDGSPDIADAVQLRVGDGDASGEQFRIDALDVAGSVLFTQTITTWAGPDGGGATFRVCGGDIHALTVTGVGFMSGGAVDDLVVERHAPGCRTDLNRDCIVNTQDFLAFLGLWAARDPGADWNGDGRIDTLDFIAYLNAWVQGC